MIFVLLHLCIDTLKYPSLKKTSIDKLGNKRTIIEGNFQFNDEDVELLSKIKSNLNKAKSTSIKVTSLTSTSVASPLTRSTTPVNDVSWTLEGNTLRSQSE